MRSPRFILLSFIGCVLAACTGITEAEGDDLLVNGEPWAHTVTTPYDDSRAKNRTMTYKVYTHLYDFDGGDFLTKGVGGLYTHHRGLFIGWMQTDLGGETVDSWHMRGCYQEHLEWLTQENGDSSATQSQIVEWRTNDHRVFLRETRSLRASAGSAGERVFDVESRLEATTGPVVLRGDAQHAGMQVRLANEISKHPDTTRYVLPSSATAGEDDTVVGANWARANVLIGGSRYSIVHMTPPDHPTGTPIYSIRDYGRFGAFFETTVEPDAPLDLRFRIVVSRDPLDQAACQDLYDQYANL